MWFMMNSQLWSTNKERKKILYNEKIIKIANSIENNKILNNVRLSNYKNIFTESDKYNLSTNSPSKCSLRMSYIELSLTTIKKQNSVE